MKFCVDHSLKKHNLIFDLDGTLYPLTPEMQESRFDAAAKTALEAGFKGSFEEARAIAVESLNKHKYEMRDLFPRCTWTYGELERVFLNNISLNSLKPDPGLVKLLRKSGKKLGVITHITSEPALRTLKRIGLDRDIPQERIFAMDDYNYRLGLPPEESGIPDEKHLYKFNSHVPFDLMAKAMHVLPEKCIFVEDSEHNLKEAHLLGMTTVLLRPKRMDGSKKPDFVDFEFETLVAFLHELNGKKTAKDAATQLSFAEGLARGGQGSKPGLAF